jgi:hypothetical protein
MSAPTAENPCVVCAMPDALVTLPLGMLVFGMLVARDSPGAIDVLGKSVAGCATHGKAFARSALVAGGALIDMGEAMGDAVAADAAKAGGA